MINLCALKKVPLAAKYTGSVTNKTLDRHETIHSRHQLKLAIMSHRDKNTRNMWLVWQF